MNSNLFTTISPDIHCTIDFNGVLTSINPAIGQILAYHPDDLIGGNFTDIVIDHDKKRIREKFNAIITEKMTNLFECTCIDKFGASREISWTCLSSQDEKLLYAIGRDVSQQKAAQNQFNCIEDTSYELLDCKGKSVNLEMACQKIRELKSSQKKLSESESQFKRAITNSPVPIMIHDEDDQVIQISKGWTKYSGYTIEDIPTYSDWTLKAYGRASARNKRCVDKLFAIHDSVDHGEWTITAKDGSKRIWSFKTTSLGRNSRGKRLLHSMAIDISESVLAKEKMIKSNLLLEDMEKIAKIGGWEIDINSMQGNFTKQTFDIYEIDDLIIPSIEEGINYYQEEYRYLIINAVEQAIKNNIPYDIEIPFISAKGNRKWVRTQGHSYFENGKPVRLYGTIQDITERKNVEQKLKESERKVNSIFNSLTASIVVIDEKGTILDVNEPWINFAKENSNNKEKIPFMNYNYFEVCKQGASDSDSMAVLKGIQEVLNGTVEVFDHEYSYDLPSEKRWFVMRAVLMKGDEKKVVISHVDITKRKIAEIEVKRSEEKFYRAFNYSPLPMEIVNIETGNRLSVNEKFVELFERSEEELVVGNLYKGNSSVDMEVFYEVLRLVKKNGFLYNYPFDIYTRSKHIKNTLVSVQNLYHDNSPYYILSFVDISEQKRAEELLAKNERKMYEAIVNSEERERSRYAKELHDGLGPVLSTSKIYLHAIKDESNKEKQLEFLERANDLLDDATNSIKEVTNNLSPDILNRFGLVQAVKSFIEKLSHVSNIKFAIDSNVKSRYPEVVEITIYRTLTELINNSIKYAEASHIAIGIHAADGFLKVDYSDDGVGFDRDKPEGKNTGFGLLNIENRVKKINGKYLLNTRPGEGVKVSISVKTSCV